GEGRARSWLWKIADHDGPAEEAYRQLRDLVSHDHGWWQTWQSRVVDDDRVQDIEPLLAARPAGTSLGQLRQWPEWLAEGGRVADAFNVLRALPPAEPGVLDLWLHLGRDHGRLDEATAVLRAEDAAGNLAARSRLNYLLYEQRDLPGLRHL